MGGVIFLSLAACVKEGAVTEEKKKRACFKRFSREVFKENNLKVLITTNEMWRK